MKTDISRGALAVGIFFIGGIALLLAGIIFFGDGSLLHKRQRAVAYFDGSLYGLTVGAPVTFRGVRVGSVERIEVRIDAAQATSETPVYLSLNPRAAQWAADGGPMDIPDLVQRGLRAQLALQSFVTGQLYVVLDFYPAQLPPVLKTEAGSQSGTPEVPTMPSEFAQALEIIQGLPVADMMESMHSALDAIDTLARQLNDDVPEVRDELLLLLTNLNQTLPAMAEDFSTLQQDLARLGEDLSGAINNIDAMAGDIGEELSAFAEDMRTTAETLRRASDGITALLGEEAPAHGDIELMLHDMSRAARALRNLTELLEEQPNRLIFSR